MKKRADNKTVKDDQVTSGHSVSLKSLRTLPKTVDTKTNYTVDIYIGRNDYAGIDNSSKTLLKASNAVYAANVLVLSLSAGKNRLKTISSFGPLSATKKVPTGFGGVPPLGPAIPVMESPHTSLGFVISEDEESPE